MARSSKQKRRKVYDTILYACGEVTCFCCGKSVSWEESSLEHKWPLVFGGKSLGMGNITISHISCNNKRGCGISKKKPTTYTGVKIGNYYVTCEYIARSLKNYWRVRLCAM